MKPAVFSESGKPLTIETVDDPTPQATDLVVKVHACGICGTDLHMTEDHGPHFTYPKGTIPGHEYSGVVVETGKDVSQFKVGDKVCAQPFVGCEHCENCLAGRAFYCTTMRPLGAGFSEYALFGEQTTVKPADHLSFDDGALVEPLAVGLHGVNQGEVKPGDKVLIIGSGPAGLSAAFFAKRKGALVAVTATSRRREKFALSVGVDSFLVPEEGQSLMDLVMEEFGTLPDTVIEAAGAGTGLDTAVNTVEPHSTVVAMGLCTSPVSVLPATMMFKETTIRGSNTYTIDEFAHVADTLAEGAVEPRSMITKHVSLNELPDALEALRERSNDCKVIVNPWD